MKVSRTEIATSLGISKAAVSQWFAEGSRVPSERCPVIEQATNGRVICEDLRPDVPWSRIPDPGWPHPDGRPVIDVARPVDPRPADQPAEASHAQ